MYKFSIITVTLNSEKTIINTLNSVISQTCKHIEHIFVDGGSKDNTVKIIKKYLFKNKKIIIAKNSTIYSAINIGIKKSSGQIISILNSDDFYNNSKVLENIYKKFEKNKTTEVVSGNVVYFNNNKFTKITRLYKSSDFKKKELYLGIIPPHTGTFIKKSTYNKLGLYNEEYKIASDFDYFIKIFKNKINFKRVNFVVTRMKAGGVSGKNILSNIKSSIEIINSLKNNQIKQSSFKISLRFIKKIHQLYKFDTNKLNKDFEIIPHPNYKLEADVDFKILLNTKKIFDFEKFIFSAMNLAFLGSYVQGYVKKNSDQINWPDGMFSKIFGLKISKKPGRVILQQVLSHIKKNKNRLVIFGNLEIISKKYLEKKIKKKVIHIDLPYGNVEYIKKYINYKLKKNDICLITLPTPKQEVVAYELAKKNNSYKIICIGASVNMLSGIEKPVPKMFSNYEFIWRLRYETKRRTIRLVKTFYFFVLGFFTNKIKKLNVKIIN